MLNLGPGVTVPAAGSATPTAVRRLQKDYMKLMQDPVDGIKALPNDENILEWHYCLRGSPDTPFQGGFYWGKVIFKENFPWSPPAITMITPNGRFATNTRLCLSISDYHPESWNPGWTVSAILIGLHSFMNENQPAAGSVAGTPQEQRNLASASKEFNVKYREFRRFFPQFVKEWTGVLPTPNEPDVAPTMLPEHATPQGVQVPNIQHHSSRAAFANRAGFDEVMNVFQAARQVMQNVAGAPPMRALPQQPVINPYPGDGIGLQGLLYPMPAVQPVVPQPALYRDLAALAQQQAIAAAAAAAPGPIEVAQAPRQLRPRGAPAAAPAAQQPDEQLGRGFRRAVRRNQPPQDAAIPEGPPQKRLRGAANR